MKKPRSHRSRQYVVRIYISGYTFSPNGTVYNLFELRDHAPLRYTHDITINGIASTRTCCVFFFFSFFFFPLILFEIEKNPMVNRWDVCSSINTDSLFSRWCYFEIFHRENVCYVTVAVSLKRENVECRDT